MRRNTPALGLVYNRARDLLLASDMHARRSAYDIEYMHERQSHYAMGCIQPSRAYLCLSESANMTELRNARRAMAVRVIQQACREERELAFADAALSQWLRHAGLGRNESKHWVYPTRCTLGACE